MHPLILNLLETMENVSITEHYQLPQYFDLFAVFLFAFTGSITAIERGYDFVGVFALALVTSTGGAIIRDTLLQNGSPAVLHDYRYILMVLLAGLTGIYFNRFNKHLSLPIKVIDAISLGMYAVFGTQKALSLGLGIFAAFIIGFVNAVGGGLIRDVLTRQEPTVFKPGHYYSVASIGAIAVFLLLVAAFDMSATWAAWIAIAVSFLLRFSALRFNWTTKPFKHV